MTEMNEEQFRIKLSELVIDYCKKNHVIINHIDLLWSTSIIRNAVLYQINIETAGKYIID